MKSAFVKAAAKLGIGLTLVAAIIGIRMVSVTPEGVPAAIEKLEQLDSEIAAEVGATEQAADAAATDNESGSLVSRLGAGISEHLPGGESRRAREGNRLVSCRFDSRTQFMRADDCAVRGGVPTVLPENN